ncbi:MAG: AzlD domain-containing protein [Actinomycetota bacterium]
MIGGLTMVALAVGVYGQRLAGMVAARFVEPDGRWQAVLAAVPLAIIAAVVALQVATSGGSPALDARLAGLAAAALCAWRRLPLAVVVLAAAATTALVRAIT